MGTRSAAQITLVVGDDPLLVDRAVSTVIADQKAVDSSATVVTLTADDVATSDLDMLLSPSLFGEREVVVLPALQDLSVEDGKRLAPALDELPEEVAVVAVHNGGQKGKALLKQVAERAGRRIDCPRLTRYRDRLDFVRTEVERQGGTVSDGAARALLEGVGSDLAELAMACAQLVADTDGRVTEDAVRRYHAIPAEVSGFAVADAAVDGDAAAALAQLRWALATGVAPVLITSALASGLRQIARVASAGRGARTADLARELGMPSWKVERVQRQLRGWRPEGIATALAAVAEADAAVKGAGVDPAYALERAVLAVTAARTAT